MIGRGCLFTAADKSPSALLEPPLREFHLRLVRVASSFTRSCHPCTRKRNSDVGLLSICLFCTSPYVQQMIVGVVPRPKVEAGLRKKPCVRIQRAGRIVDRPFIMSPPTRMQTATSGGFGACENMASPDQALSGSFY